MLLKFEAEATSLKPRPKGPEANAEAETRSYEAEATIFDFRSVWRPRGFNISAEKQGYLFSLLLFSVTFCSLLHCVAVPNTSVQLGGLEILRRNLIRYISTVKIRQCACAFNVRLNILLRVCGQQAHLSQRGRATHIVVGNFEPLNVIGNATIRQIAYKFLPAFHSNCGHCIFYHFRHKATYQSKMAIFFHTHLHSTPRQGSPSEDCHAIQ